MLAIESNANPLTERPHTVTTALASLAMDREHYNVVRNVFSEKSSGRQRLESCLFRVKALQEAPELCKEPPRKEMATLYRIYGIVLRRGNVMPIIGSSLDSDETYRRNLLPSETRIQPLNMHRVVNHRFQTTIDLMAGFAGMRA